MSKNINTANSATENAIVATKRTKKELFNILFDFVDSSNHELKKELSRFILNEIRLIDKRSTKKTSNVQRANEVILEAIKEVLSELDTPQTISQLLDDSRLQTYEVEEKGEKKVLKMSGQKLSALVTSLVKKGEIIRTEAKKKAYFELAK